jgi:hypothetical protein
VSYHIVRCFDSDEDEYMYEFSFTPVKPIDPEYRQAYGALQRAWLENWKPYSWHFIQ